MDQGTTELIGDTDLYPCPWCRGELVSSIEYDTQDFRVECASCYMNGPSGVTPYVARSAYNVVAKLINGTLNAIFTQDPGTTPAQLRSAAHDYIIARREHAPY